MPSEPLAATVRRATPPAGPEAVFRMLKVCKVYRMGETEVHALRDVDLELLPGEFVVLLGASGSGKSTLLNILGGLDLRLWLNDDPAQNKPIDTLLAAHGSMPGSLLVTDVVLVEAVWTLKSAFQQDPQAQALAVRSLLAETAFAFEDRDAVAAAPGPFEAGSCEFADSLVVAKHVRQGCDFTATFDRRMRKLPGVKVH